MSAGAAAGAGAGAGASGSGAPLSEAEQRYTKRAILQLLESEYEDEGCQVLFGALSALPSHDPRLLLGLMAAVAKAQSATVAPDDWGRALAVFDLECAKCVHQIVLNILLRELRQLSGHVKFWKTSIQSPVSHFLVNGRFEWFRNRPRGLEWSGLLTSFIPFVGSSAWGKYLSHVQRADVNEKLDRLDQCEESFAAQVGHLHSWIGHMEKIVSFRADVRAFNQYVAKLFDFVSGTSGREAGNDAIQVLHQLEDTLHALPEFESWFSTQLAPYRKPSHVRRHWLAYAMVGVGSVFVANKLYTNRAELAAWGRASARDAGAFVHSHFTEPVHSLYHSVFHTFRDRQNLAASREQLELSRQSLAAMLQDFGANPAKQAQLQAQREGKSHAQYIKELPARAAAHDMSIVMPRYEDGVAHPIKSLSNGELVRGLLIQVQKVKVDSEAAMLAMDQVLKANELNFSVLAIIPAVVLFGFGMLAVKRLVFRKPSRAVLHRRMRRQLRRIESVLIAHYGSGKPSLDDKSTGFLLLYLQKLDDLVRNGLPQREQTDILSDIATLRSVDLGIQQKHLMIARMYRAYALTDDKTI